MTSFESLDIKIDGHVATVTLVGPGRGNTMGPEFWREMPVAFAELGANADVRAIVITGSGGNFSYGLDLGRMLAQWSDALAANATAGPRTRFMHAIRDCQAAMNAVADCRKPVIAAVSGWCVGGGVDLIAACDIRLASADAKFSIREVKLSIVADVGSLQRLSGVIGEGHLRELAYTGKDIDAARAREIGLLNDVHADPDAALAAAQELAAEIAANSPLAVEGVKEALDLPRHRAIEDGLRHASIWSAAFLASDDLTEAVTAFQERRPATFHGR